MKKNLVAALATVVLTSSGLCAVADTPAPRPMPSASIGMEIDVKPNESSPGQFLVNAVVTDLESGAVIEKPRLLIAANQPARIEIGTAGKWTLEINVVADGASRTATCNASFTREGKVVSKQRVSVKLDA